MNLEESVKAAVGLSFLQPSGFVEKMSQVLETEPHRLLKKQIILALGYSHESKATEILLENFMSDQEEIQITVLEAMKIAKNFRATRFAVDLLLSKKQSLTPRVRLSAAQMIAALYGKKSIPILLQGLGEDDPRLVANTLEALGHFHDLEILQIVKPYIKSEIPRVRANALMYIHKFSSQKKIFKEEIRKTLSSVDEKRTAEKISIFYVIGKIKDKTFLPDLNRIFQSKASEFLNLNIEDDVKISFFQTLLWALYRLDEDTSGQKLYDLLIKFTDKFQRRSVLHFFLQLDASERYDLLDLWLKIANNPKGVRENLLDIFNESGLNLFEEVEYLKSLKFYRA